MIKFLSISIKNFTSWKELYLPLDAEGIVCIQGMTGGGKSSLFKSIFWCLFGHTPEATKADEIQRGNSPTRVKLRLEKDNKKYSIIRYRNHPIWKNKVVFSGHGIPEVVEDSYIKTVQGLIYTFLGIDETIFLTTTLFAQRNFHHFHMLTDTQKKQYIESLTYGRLFEKCESIVRDKVATINSDMYRLEGELSGLDHSIKTVRDQKNRVEADVQRKIDDLNNKIKQYSSLRVKYKDKQKILTNDVIKYEHFQEQLTKYEEKIELLNDDIERYKSQDAICPRCGLTMLPRLREEKIHDSLMEISHVQKKMNISKEKSKKYSSSSDRSGKLQSMVWSLEDKIAQLTTQISVYKRSIVKTNSLDELEKRLQEVQSLLSDSKNRLRYYDFWAKGFGFQGLRSFVLINAIKYLNSRIQLYLDRIVGNRIDFIITLENTRLVVECNNRSYPALSGGERQAVDVCTGLALRDLAELYNKADFNILLCDEPFEGLDKNLTAAAQDLLLDYAKPSTFLVTHREALGGFSKILLVKKIHNQSTLQRIY